MISNLLSTVQVSIVHARLLWGTYSDRSSVTQGTPPVHIEFPGTPDNVNLLDELLVRANKRRFTLAREFGSSTEVGLSAGCDFPSIS